MAETICSAQVDEPLPGTAKPFKLFIALEHQYGWSHDILDGGVFGEEVTARLKAWLEQRGGKLQLIRKPGRLGQVPCDGINLFVSHCVPGSISDGAGDNADSSDGVYLEHRMVADVEELMTLDIRLGQQTEGATQVTHPLLFVCTHGKRDRCCAVKGRPVAAALDRVYPDMIWETSHSKGHRFAPAVIVLPWNFAYGRLSAMETKHVLDDALVGKLHAQGYRGRGIYSAPGQVAELAVREATGAWGVSDIASVEVSEVVHGHATAVVSLRDAFSAENAQSRNAEGSDSGQVGADSGSHQGAETTTATGRKYTVAVEEIVTEGVVSSCGDEPGPKKGFAAREVTRC